MLNIKIEKAKGKGWFLKIGSQTIALTSIEVWALMNVLEPIEKEINKDILNELNPDKTNL